MAGRPSGDGQGREGSLALPGGRWHLWTSVALRGAGFPVALVEVLCSEPAARLADAYLDRQKDVAARQSATRLALLDRLKSAGPEERAELRRWKHKLKQGTLCIDALGRPDAALVAAISGRDAARAAFAEAYAHDEASLESRTRAQLQNERLCAAALWQNHRSFDGAKRRLNQPSGPAVRRRAAENFVAMLIQRYAVKNDSIGFFGPVGWARINDVPVILEHVHGPLIAHREVFFEEWCIDELARHFNRDPEMRRWLTPRLRSGIWLHGEEVRLPMLGNSAVSEAQLQLLRLCNGNNTATAISAAVMELAAPPYRSEESVFEALLQLEARGILSWKCEVAPQLYPERALAAQIDRVENVTLRTRCLVALQKFTAARDRVARCAERPPDLLASLDELDRVFVEVTGAAPTRRAGETYAARGLLYEDCRRGGEVILGAPFFDRIGPALSLVLDGARWAAAELSESVRSHLRRHHAALQMGGDCQVIDGHAFFTSAASSLAEALPPMLDALSRRYQANWLSILEPHQSERVVQRRSADVIDTAKALFATTSTPWADARYFSPDVLVASPGIEAFRRGAFHCVLGEIHCANTLVRSALLTQHPDPASLVEALEIESRGETIVSAQKPKGESLARLHVASPAGWWRYEHGRGLANEPRGRSAPAAMMAAIDDGHSIRMRARDGTLEFDALDLFSRWLSTAVQPVLSNYLMAAPHARRVTIDELTISRERWRLAPAQLPFLSELSRDSTFLAVRAWRREWGMPRQLFYKAPDETKPCYLDLDSPIYVRLFAKTMSRQAPHATIRIEEMLPLPSESWLEDADGAHYTSEFRFAARHVSS